MDHPRRRHGNSNTSHRAILVADFMPSPKPPASFKRGVKNAMKRSQPPKLALLSASVLTLTACDNTDDVSIFETLEQCVNQDGFSREACKTNMQSAKQEHARVAPKYTSAADSEADFGPEQCETAPQITTSSGSVFMPLMMGYMMGNLLAGPSRIATQPLYRSKDNPGNFRTADNQKFPAKLACRKHPRARQNRRRRRRERSAATGSVRRPPAAPERSAISAADRRWKELRSTSETTENPRRKRSASIFTRYMASPIGTNPPAPAFPCIRSKTISKIRPARSNSSASRSSRARSRAKRSWQNPQFRNSTGIACARVG